MRPGIAFVLICVVIGLVLVMSIFAYNAYVPHNVTTTVSANAKTSVGVGCAEGGRFGC